MQQALLWRQATRSSSLVLSHAAARFPSGELRQESVQDRMAYRSSLPRDAMHFFRVHDCSRRSASDSPSRACTSLLQIEIIYGRRCCVIGCQQ